MANLVYRVCREESVDSNPVLVRDQISRVLGRHRRGMFLLLHSLRRRLWRLQLFMRLNYCSERVGQKSRSKRARGKRHIYASTLLPSETLLPPSLLHLALSSVELVLLASQLLELESQRFFILDLPAGRPATLSDDNP